MTEAGAPRTTDRILRWIGHQSWIPRRHHIVRSAWRRVARPVELEVAFYGLRYRAQLSDWTDWNVYFFGAYARSELAFIWRAVEALRAAGRASISAADVGANVGHHALFMSRIVDNVWAFEPYEPVRRRLVAAIERNRIDNIRVVPLGLSDSDAELAFNPPPAWNLGLGSFVGGGGPPMRVRQGDRLLDAEGVPRLDLIKIDVEGLEPKVLRGLSERLRRDRPVMMIEILNTPEFTDEASVRKYLYPNAALFDLRRSGDTYWLAPFRPGRSREAVVIPQELLMHWPAASERAPRHGPGKKVWGRS